MNRIRATSNGRANSVFSCEYSRKPVEYSALDDSSSKRYGVPEESSEAMKTVEGIAAKVLPLTDEAVILERGLVVHAGASAAVGPELLERHLGLAAR